MEALLKKKDDWTESVTVSELSSCNSGESKESCSSSSGSSSGNLVDKVKVNNKAKGSGPALASPPPLLGWPIRRATTTVSKNSDVSNGNGDADNISNEDDKFKKLGSKING